MSDLRPALPPHRGVIVAHAGKQHSYHLARALHRLGALSRFVTSSYVTLPAVQAWVEGRPASQIGGWLRRRYEPGLAAPYVEANWALELPEVWLRARRAPFGQVQAAVARRDVRFDEQLAARLHRIPGAVYWGFQGSAHASLGAARATGRQAWLELAAAHHPAVHRLLTEEARRHPDWADSVDVSGPTDPVYERRLIEEPARADRIIAASHWTARTLIDEGHEAARIRVLPLGADLSRIPYPAPVEDQSSSSQNRPLRMLYAGRLTAGKGLPYLLEAVKGLGQGGAGADIELHLIGKIQGEGRGLEAYRGHFVYHPPVSQGDLFARYGQYDALVLPSLSEGFGLVLLEAMAAGLPFIATPNTMAPDLLEAAREAGLPAPGQLVPIRDAGALAGAITAFATTSPEGRRERRLAARALAERYTWQAYQARLAALIEAEGLWH